MAKKVESKTAGQLRLATGRPSSLPRAMQRWPARPCVCKRRHYAVRRMARGSEDNALPGKRGSLDWQRFPYGRAQAGCRRTGERDDPDRDLDQTEIGSPADDLICLGLSQATTPLQSHLSGLTAVDMTEALADGSDIAFERAAKSKALGDVKKPESAPGLMKEVLRRSCMRLAAERL
ncbi:hypothetical protein bAD24_p01115 (plasmid) [Burkholderia sp. AD24]|nr:hypothetical protein bAD24_p01115 [Burkholderia sp. AD24]